MLLEVSRLTRDETYKLLSGTVVPRPVAFISTLSPQGVANCAPFSFFNILCSDPPLVGICIGRRGQRSAGMPRPKDTLVNAQHTGDFVVNLTPEPLAEKMNLAAIPFPPDTSEFSEVGLTPAPSVHVRAPRIAEAPVNMECVVETTHTYVGRTHVTDFLVGRVVAFHIADGLVNERLHMDFHRLQPVGRLAGSLYCRMGEVYELVRPSLEDYRSDKR